jgi:hypothetical protein
MVPDTDSMMNNNTKHLRTNKIRFLDSIFWPENLSIASKFANTRAFFLPSFKLKK